MGYKHYFGYVSSVPWFFGFGRHMALKRISKDISKKFPGIGLIHYKNNLGLISYFEFKGKQIKGNVVRKAICGYDEKDVQTIYMEIICNDTTIEGLLNHYTGECKGISFSGGKEKKLKKELDNFPEVKEISQKTFEKEMICYLKDQGEDKNTILETCKDKILGLDQDLVKRLLG